MQQLSDLTDTGLLGLVAERDKAALRELVGRHSAWLLLHADHACQRLDYLADYHAAITRADSDRAELLLTLPAEDAHHAGDQALGLVTAIGHRPIRVDVLLAEDYDRRNRQ